MSTYMLPPPFVGDLSTRDALELAILADKRRVLEHGAGGSTQIFAAVAKEILSIEPVAEWRQTTVTNLVRLRALGYTLRDVQFQTVFDAASPGVYDLIFVDGPSSDRDAFSYAAFRHLAPGGCMVFHDARVKHERAKVLAVAAEFGSRISHITLNEYGSNLAVIYRNDSEIVYSDWNVDEGRQEWEIGRGEPPPGWDKHVNARSARVLGQK